MSGSKTGTEPLAEADVTRSCDGSLGDVPKDFPPLGAACRSHFTLKWTSTQFDTTGLEDVASGRGVRKMPAPIKGIWDLGVFHPGSEGSGGWSNIWLFIPSLAPGVYRIVDRASTAHDAAGDGRFTAPQAVRIEIVGASAAAIWGRFITVTCASAYNKHECFRTDHGRFAAAIDDVESALELGVPQFEVYDGSTSTELCDSAADCSKRGECDIISCSSASYCQSQSADAACDVGQRCDSIAVGGSKCVAK